MEVHEDRLTGEEKFTNPVYSPSRSLLLVHPSSLRGVRLNIRGCAAKVLYAAQPPRRSSSRVGAVQRDEGGRRTGQVGALSISSIKTNNYVFGFEIKRRWNGRSPSHPPLLVFFTEWEAWGKRKSNFKLEFGTSTRINFKLEKSGHILHPWPKNQSLRSATCPKTDMMWTLYFCYSAFFGKPS